MDVSVVAVLNKGNLRGDGLVQVFHPILPSRKVSVSGIARRNGYGFGGILSEPLALPRPQSAPEPFEEQHRGDFHDREARRKESVTRTACRRQSHGPQTDAQNHARRDADPLPLRTLAFQDCQGQHGPHERGAQSGSEPREQVVTNREKDVVVQRGCDRERDRGDERDSE